MERARKVGAGFLTALILLAALPAFANTKADFLIVGEVRPLLIYNQYQQRLSADEKADIPSFAPFKILETDAFLGDGFTPCMKVEVRNRIFFLEKDTAGRLAGSENVTFLRVFRSALPVGDTIEVLKNNRLSLSDPEQKLQSPLAQGTRLVRLFSHQSNTYVRTLGSGSRFGWVQFDSRTDGRDWRIARDAGVALFDRLEKAIPPIQLKVNEANSKLVHLYDYFNRESTVHRQPPRWRVDAASDSVVCVLESETDPAHFAESSRALGKSIEGALLGSGLRVAISPGRLVIDGGRSR